MLSFIDLSRKRLLGYDDVPEDIRRFCLGYLEMQCEPMDSGPERPHAVHDQVQQDSGLRPRTTTPFAYKGPRNSYCKYQYLRHSDAKLRRWATASCFHPQTYPS